MLYIYIWDKNFNISELCNDDDDDGYSDDGDYSHIFMGIIRNTEFRPWMRNYSNN